MNMKTNYDEFFFGLPKLRLGLILRRKKKGLLIMLFFLAE